jgi:hypothetical protein
MKPWQTIVLFRQGGSWLGQPETAIDRLRLAWLKPLALPQSAVSAVEFDLSEIDDAVSLFTIQQLFGMCAWDDTYAIPDHGEQMLHTSHHEVVEIEFRDGRIAKSFVKQMKREEFELPSEVPDETFKIPDWMK